MLRLKLTDKIWQEAKGGYKLPYDASIPLRQLELANDEDRLKKIWKELWNGLHHQGDVGLASYLALPQLVRIGRSKGLFDSNLLGLCCVIEQQRHLGNNPILSLEFRAYYDAGLDDLKKFILDNINSDLDDTTYIVALSALAACAVRPKLSKAILEMEDNGVLDEFLEQF